MAETVIHTPPELRAAAAQTAEELEVARLDTEINRLETLKVRLGSAAISITEGSLAGLMVDMWKGRILYDGLAAGGVAALGFGISRFHPTRELAKKKWATIGRQRGYDKRDRDIPAAR